MQNDNDTIVAVSTAAGVGAIGIVRLSGSRAFDLGARIFRAPGGGSLGKDSHRLQYGHILEEQGQVVDEVLTAFMPGPRTYTREDVVEIHCHGGPTAVRTVLQMLIQLGARPAEPGEFTKRAFLNGRIDLTQAESVAALVSAQSASALRAAVNQLQGGLAGRLREVRGRLVGVLAGLEATIDFADEDIDHLDRAAAAEELMAVRASLDSLLATAFVGRALDHGVRTAIAGRPNVGKSSLLNALLMRERAIVSEIPGTTRDTVEEMVEVGGVPLHLVDTAGIRESRDLIEKLGIARSRLALETADLTLAVLDASTPLDAEDLRLLHEIDPGRTIIVGNKSDLVPERRANDFRAEVRAHLRGVPTTAPGPGASLGTVLDTVLVSAKSGEGLDELRDAISRAVLGEHGLQLEEPILANERQRRLVEEARIAIEAALAGLQATSADELVCEDIREGAQALGRVTGEELVPDLLDEIFRRFCIGK